MLINFIAVTVWCLYAYVNIHQIVQFKYVQFIEL